MRADQIQPYDEGFMLVRIIEAEAKRRIAEVIDEEAKSAQARVTQRVKGVVDEIAMNVMARYELSAYETHIVIKVDKRDLDKLNTETK